MARLSQGLCGRIATARPAWRLRGVAGHGPCAALALLRGLLCLLALLAAGWPAQAQAQPSSLPQQTFHWRDDSGQAGLAQVLEPGVQAAFERWDEDRGVLNLGYTRSVHWVRWEITRPPGQPSLWVLEIPYQGLMELDLHLPGGQVVRGGSARPWPAQQHAHRFPAVRLDLQPGLNVVHLRVATHNPLTVPLRLWSPQAFLSHVQATTVLQALYFGGLLAMVLYNFFLAVSLRDRRFLGYVLFALALGLGMLSGNGYGRLYLWSDSPAFDEVAQVFFLCLAAAFSIDFSRTFLQLARRAPRVNGLLLAGEALMLCYALAFLVSLAWPFELQLWNQSLALTVLGVGVLIMVQGLRALRQGLKGVRFFMLAWSVLWLGVFTATFRSLGWLPSNTFTMYAIQISSALEMLLLAFALADIVHQERSERDVAQSLALQLKEDMVRQLRLSEDGLERAVEQRTGQLEDALARQRQVLDQYVRFGALISHEFRNPLGIIQSQVSVVRKAFPLERDGADLHKRLDIIASATRRLAQLFDRWLQGGRLQQLGEQVHMEALNLSTWVADLLASHPQYAADHDLQLALDPAAPPVLADQALLEMALLNLVDNACKYSPAGSRVRLSLQQRPGRVGLAVEDQGPGIAPEQQRAVFQDYTRLQADSAVRGLGLGLALVERIARLLGGSIELSSAPGRGSTFCLWLAAAPPDA